MRTCPFCLVAVIFYGLAAPFVAQGGSAPGTRESVVQKCVPLLSDYASSMAADNALGLLAAQHKNTNPDAVMHLARHLAKTTDSATAIKTLFLGPANTVQDWFAHNHATWVLRSAVDSLAVKVLDAGQHTYDSLVLISAIKKTLIAACNSPVPDPLPNFKHYSIRYTQKALHVANYLLSKVPNKRVAFDVLDILVVSPSTVKEPHAPHTQALLNRIVDKLYAHKAEEAEVHAVLERVATAAHLGQARSAALAAYVRAHYNHLKD